MSNNDVLSSKTILESFCNENVENLNKQLAEKKEKLAGCEKSLFEQTQLKSQLITNILNIETAIYTLNQTKEQVGLKFEEKEKNGKSD